MEEKSNARPIFICGCPRSGTTAMGSYIGSANDVSFLGEYMAYALINRIGPRLWEDTRPRGFTHRDVFAHLTKAAHEFASDIAHKEGNHFYEDDTPKNIQKIHELDELEPKPIYIAMVRSPAGVVRSLQQNFERGFTWSGTNEKEQLDQWCMFNKELPNVPKDRGYVMVYEQFILHPEEELQKLSTYLAQFGVDLTTADKRSLLMQHANGAEAYFEADPETGSLQPTHAACVKIQADLDASKSLCEKYSEVKEMCTLVQQASGIDYSMGSPKKGRPVAA